jgi:small-conductance mechanosensitive channel
VEKTMNSNDIDKIELSGTKAKGQRPWFLQDKQTEQVLSIAMALATELAVTRERLATLEAVLQQQHILTADAIEAYRPSSAEVAERSEAIQQYWAQILRVVQQDKEALSAGDKSMEQLQAELTSR